MCHNNTARCAPHRKADVVAFGADGVYAAAGNDNYQEFHKVHNLFGRVAGGFDVAKHIRLVADVDGKGSDDLVGFGDGGVHIATNDGKGTFGAEKMVMGAFAVNDGWRLDQHIRLMADIRNTGRLDIVGFGSNGVYISQNNGNGSFSPWYLAVNNFAYDQTWRIEKHARILGDITGDGTLDIVGFGEGYVYVGRNLGNGRFGLATTTLTAFTYNAGWRGNDVHPRFLADLNGNGAADIIGFKGQSVFVSINDGKGNFETVPHLATAGFLACADGDPGFVQPLTRTGIMDILRFGEDGVYVARGNGDGTFQAPVTATSDFARRDGWTKAHKRVLADTTGNGLLDIVGFKDSEVYIALNKGWGTFAPVKRVAANFPGEAGHLEPQTVRTVGNIFPKA